MIWLGVAAAAVGLGILARLLPNGEEKAGVFDGLKQSMAVEKANGAPRQYLGLLGCALALAGGFMPYVDFWLYRASFYETLAEEQSWLGIAAAVALMLLGVVFLLRLRAPAVVFSGVLLAAFWVYTFTGNTIFGYTLSIGDMMEYLEFGFWIVSLGLILALLSPFMRGANRALSKLFQA